MVRHVLAFGGFVLAFLAASFGYDSFVVPRLPQVQAVPMWWWLLCCVPAIAVGAYFGWKAKDLWSVLSLSCVGAAAYIAALQFTGQRFHDIEPGSQYHYIQLFASTATVFIAVLLIVALGWISHALVKRRSA